ncbi:MAG: hypothetical protein ACHQ50_17790, partial [Fimbriimonadales bacterium]
MRPNLQISIDRAHARIKHLAAVRVDADELLKALFESAGKELWADKLDAEITVELRDTPFDVGLAELLQLAHASASCEDGRYAIRSAANAGGLSFAVRDMDVREAVARLMGGRPYMIAPDVRGRITLSLTDTDRKSALRALLYQTNGMVIEDEEVCRIVPIPPTVAPAPLNLEDMIVPEVGMDHVDVREGLR